MKIKSFVLFVTLLFILNAILMIVPQDKIVKADTPPPIPEIDYDYIYNVTEWLSKVINNSYEEYELAKGRAFGSKGEHDAAQKIAFWMNETGLHDPTTTTYPSKSYREKITDKLYPLRLFFSGN